MQAGQICIAFVFGAPLNVSPEDCWGFPPGFVEVNACFLSGLGPLCTADRGGCKQRAQME